jgi:hypothetical protein
MNMQQQQHQLVVAHQLLMERQNVPNLLSQQQPVNSSRTTGTASTVDAVASMTNPTSPQQQQSPSDKLSSPEQ